MMESPPKSESSINPTELLCKIIEQTVLRTNDIIAFISKSSSPLSNSQLSISTNFDNEGEDLTQKVLQIVDSLLKSSRIAHSLQLREKKTVALIQELTTTVGQQVETIKLLKIKEFQREDEQRKRKSNVADSCSSTYEFDVADEVCMLFADLYFNLLLYIC